MISLRPKHGTLYDGTAALNTLNNAVKHAHASEVRVGVRLVGDVLTLSIEDNGRGVAGDVAKAEPTSAKLPLSSGRGVRNMRQRVETLGGEFEWHQSAETGTHLRASLPLGKAK